MNLHGASSSYKKIDSGKEGDMDYVDFAVSAVGVISYIGALAATSFFSAPLVASALTVIGIGASIYL